MNPKLAERLLEISFINRLLEVSKRISLPGFQGLSLHEVTVFFYHTIAKGAVTSRASAVAYSFFIALFPAIIFFFTIIPYLPIADFQHTLMELLQGLMPENAYLTIESTVYDIVTRRHGGLLSFGFLTALYFSTSGINSLILAFNMSIHTTERRKVFKQRMVSLVLVIILALLTIIAIALLTVGTFVLNYLESIGILNDWLIIYAPPGSQMDRAHRAVLFRDLFRILPGARQKDTLPLYFRGLHPGNLPVGYFLCRSRLLCPELLQIQCPLRLNRNNPHPVGLDLHLFTGVDYRV